MRRFIAFGPAFVVLITTLVTLVPAPAAVRRLGYAASDSQIRLARATLDGDDILERINVAVRSVAKSVEPSVVHIQTEVFGPRARGRTVMAQGSGWVFDNAGHIVTNAHVVQGSQGLVVQFYDGRRVNATIMGADTSTDIAVLQVPTSEGLFPIARATGQDVGQGDRVFAFGSPFGFKFSMSEGIVSGLGRDPATIIDRVGYTNYIQSDAAVNPGNSGGPLVDTKGRVVGMNVAIATASDPGQGTERGQSAGISFAIPLDTIESVVEQIISSGTVSKGYLGIKLPEASKKNPDIEAYNRTLLQSSGFKGTGVVVSEVYADGPAGKAGLESGDVIVRIKGRPATSVAGVRQAISINRPGDQLDVQVFRNGQLRDYRVTLGDLREAQTQAEQAMGRVGEALISYGFVDWMQTDEGMLMQSLRRGSRALEDGFRPGQTITKVDGLEVDSGPTLLAALADRGFAEGKKLVVIVLDPEQRANRQREITLQYKP